MSRQPSPGPSHPPSYTQLYQVPPPTHSRPKPRAYPSGVAAGAEDVKYQGKYRELKRKVKEIESDNDKLYFKVLQAKKNIQRMRLERAILYERLSAIPPSPTMHARTLPPLATHVSQQQPQLVPDGPSQLRDVPEPLEPMDPGDHGYPEYVRVITGPDGRPVPVVEAPMGPGALPPHGRASHGSRRGSAHDVHRQYAQLPPMQHSPPAEHPLPTSHQRTHSHHSSRPHSSSRSHSSGSRSLGHPEAPAPQLHPIGTGAHLAQPPPPEPLPPLHQALQTREVSPDREPSIFYPGHPDPHLLPLQVSPAISEPQPASPHTSRGSVSSATGYSGRVHNHQRMGPGTYINRPDRHGGRSRDGHREWERERSREPLPPTTRVPTPPYARPRLIVSPTREDDEPAQMRVRGEHESAERSSYRVSSITPPAGVALQSPSRLGPSSQLYERDRATGHASRTVESPHADMDEQELPLDRPYSRPTSSDSRKRSRSTMENDDGDAAMASRGTPHGFRDAMWTAVHVELGHMSGSQLSINGTYCSTSSEEAADDKTKYIQRQNKGQASAHFGAAAASGSRQWI